MKLLAVIRCANSMAATLVAVQAVMTVLAVFFLLAHGGE